MDPPVVAVAGATGHLGQYIAEALLSSTFKKNFKSVVLLSRKASTDSPQLQKWEEAGAIIRNYSIENLSTALEGVDVLISCVGTTGTGHAFKDALIPVLNESDARLYIPSEFGVDHYIHDFEHPEWFAKRKHTSALASQLQRNKDLKVCRIFNGLFLEDSIGEWFGFHTAKGKYEAIGSADIPITFTSLADVGKAVASLAGMSPSEVPEMVHLCGDTKTMQEILGIMKAAGGGDIELSTVPMEPYRTEAIKNPPQHDPSTALRFLMGEGKINHSTTGLGNDNKLVNPEEKIWKWKSMVDLAKEENGKPWSS